MAQKRWFRNTVVKCSGGAVLAASLGSQELITGILQEPEHVVVVNFTEIGTDYKLCGQVCTVECMMNSTPPMTGTGISVSLAGNPSLISSNGHCRPDINMG